MGEAARGPGGMERNRGGSMEIIGKGATTTLLGAVHVVIDTQCKAPGRSDSLLPGSQAGGLGSAIQETDGVVGTSSAAGCFCACNTALKRGQPLLLRPLLTACA